MPDVPIITAPGIPTDPSRPLPVRDPLLTDSNGGVRFLFDVAFPWCFPGGPKNGRPAAAAPANGAPIYDMAERANGTVQIGTGGAGTLLYAGGGFDFTAAVNGGQDVGIVAPSSVLADIYAAVGGNSQSVLICMYLKVLTSARWATGSGIISVMGDRSYQSSPSLALIGMVPGTPGKYEVRRQIAGGFDGNSVTAEAEDLGTVCQLAFWRNAAGQGMRIRSLTSGKAAKIATKVAGAAGNQDFSAIPFTFGRPNAFSLGTAGAWDGHRVYRGFIENLARSGRDPAAVLDADFARQVARNLFS